MEELNASILAVLGAAIFAGTVGAAIFQRMRIPQVVGYIVIGLIIGRSGLEIVAEEELAAFHSINLFALAVIGFLVGGELHRDTFREYGKQFMGILLGEGLGAVILVGVPITLLFYYMLGSWPPALAAGLVFGAIASTTDPASTAGILWEYRSRGVLTTTLIAIVALDDALALALYGIGSSAAQILVGQDVEFLTEMMHIGFELFGAVAAGVIAAVVVRYLLVWMHQPEKSLTIAVGVLLLVVGISAALGLDVIMAAMAFGVTLTNISPLRSKQLFTIVRSFSTPIYVLFFVLVGARLSIGSMPAWLWGVVFLYILGRSSGKMIGAYIGARASGAAPAVQKYTGLGLSAQAGISVGLSIMAGQRLNGVDLGDGLYLGDVVVFCIAATTFLIQLFGPYLIKLSIQLADEIGRNVTEEDIIESMTVADVMETGIDSVSEHDSLADVFTTFSAQEHFILPVLRPDETVAGVVTLDGLKQVFASQDTWAWIVARDVLQDLGDTSAPNAQLKDAIENMRSTGVEQMLVVTPGDAPHLAGLLDTRRTRKIINEELVKKQQVAE